MSSECTEVKVVASVCLPLTCQIILEVRGGGGDSCTGSGVLDEHGLGPENLG